MPVVTADSTPLAEPIVATPVLLLLQVPPDVLLAKVVDEPTHTDVAPLMDDGPAVTVTIVEVSHPLPNE